MRPIMEWLQVVAIIFSIAGVVYWFKTDLEKNIQRIKDERNINLDNSIDK